MPGRRQVLERQLQRGRQRSPTPTRGQALPVHAHGLHGVAQRAQRGCLAVEGPGPEGQRRLRRLLPLQGNQRSVGQSQGLRAVPCTCNRGSCLSGGSHEPCSARDLLRWQEEGRRPFKKSTAARHVLPNISPCLNAAKLSFRSCFTVSSMTSGGAWVLKAAESLPPAQPQAGSRPVVPCPRRSLTGMPRSSNAHHTMQILIWDRKQNGAAGALRGALHEVRLVQRRGQGSRDPITARIAWHSQSTTAPRL